MKPLFASPPPNALHKVSLLRAFSLLELLVALVVAVVLLLLSIAGIREVSEGGRSVRCLGNLRQVTAALLAFTAENRGYFPFCVEDNENGVAGQNYWAGRLYGQGYVSDHHIFFCPSQKDDYYKESARLVKWANPSAGEWAYIGYGINRTGIAPRKRWSTNRAAQLSQIKNKAEVLLLAEADAASQIRDGWYHFLGTDVLREAGAVIEGRHHGHANVAFADGHLERRSVKKLRTENPDPKKVPWVEGVYTK